MENALTKMYAIAASKGRMLHSLEDTLNEEHFHALFPDIYYAVKLSECKKELTNVPDLFLSPLFAAVWLTVNTPYLPPSECFSDPKSLRKWLPTVGILGQYINLSISAAERHYELIDLESPSTWGLIDEIECLLEKETQ